MVNRKVESVVFFLFLVFSLIGFLMVSITLHEISHYRDYHKYADEDSICVLNVPNTFQNWTLQDALQFGVGYYEAYYDKTNETVSNEIERLEKITEIKAYSVTAITFILFIMGWAVIIIRRRELRDLEKSINVRSEERRVGKEC